MAPQLLKRELCRDEFTGDTFECHSSWNDWVRWVVLAVIIVLFFFFFILISCLSARRRRRQGLSPYRGTGWAAYNYQPPTYQQSQQQPYFTPHNQGYYSQNAPPNYSPSNAGYYGQQQGVELQSPGQSYQAGPARGGDGYAPPMGPPPAKK
ncbi:hypothetical protein NA57DRAFT_73650 [Rhizodiscina lignyota]|uniref:Uncharacterized protein n=1 Tax=Rhizodiscina lignyota TaxID=1504668 RepID=A0A9P4IMZ7_9PEZI|nr:hypothetical protein NA57DRAFT_73650 [Rhizodiscina lignyota]